MEPENYSVTASIQTDNRHWTRLPDETTKAFEAFNVYLAQGADRSITKVARQLTKSRALVARWSLRYNWRLRADVWDEDQVQQLQRAMLKERVEFQKASLRIAHKLTQAVEDGVEVLQTVKTVKEGDQERLELAIAPIDLLRLQECSMKIQQEVLGKADEDRITDIHVHFGHIKDKPPDPEPNVIEGEEA